MRRINSNEQQKLVANLVSWYPGNDQLLIRPGNHVDSLRSFYIMSNLPCCGYLPNCAALCHICHSSGTDPEIVVYATIHHAMVAQTIVASTTICHAEDASTQDQARPAKNLSGFQKSARCVRPVAGAYAQGGMVRHGSATWLQYNSTLRKNLPSFIFCVKSATFCLIQAMLIVN